MKYKRLGLIAAFSLISWLVLALVLFNESSEKNEGNGAKKGALVKYIQELESQIQHQQDLYNTLADKFSQLKHHRESAESTAQGLQDAFGQLGFLGTPSHSAVQNKSEFVQTEEINSLPSPSADTGKDPVVLPIIVFSCNRPEVRRCLDGLLKYRPDPEKFPIIVSQDCAHTATAEMIKSYAPQVTHIQQPDQSEPEVPPNENKFRGYFKIARHYLWGLNQIFRTFNHTAVIIVEDDLDIAPDFYSYFSAAYSLLLKDPTLWCVSAWNDNGKANLVDTKEGQSVLYRSDFFPGLGWMITRDLWDELEPKWPKSYWDDWMRRPEQRKDRVCIRPEISRTKTFGKIGVSNGLFFDKHLKYIKLNEEPVDFVHSNLSYLMQSSYDDQYLKQVYNLPVVSASDVRSNNVPFEGSVRITYHTKDAYKNVAKLLGLMDDFKSGVPRTGYHGIVSFFYNNRRVFLAPYSNWKGYDLTWS
nr:EOG090X06K9 [Eurycercus lamellatus]